MENKLYRLVFLTAIIFFAVGVQAQRRNARYVEYINKYSDLAVEQMKASQNSRKHHSGTGIA